MRGGRRRTRLANFLSSSARLPRWSQVALLVLCACVCVEPQTPLDALTATCFRPLMSTSSLERSEVKKIKNGESIIAEGSPILHSPFSLHTPETQHSSPVTTVLANVRTKKILLLKDPLSPSRISIIERLHTRPCRIKKNLDVNLPPNQSLASKLKYK